MPPRAPATSSAAVASSAAARCTVVNWPMTSTASAMAAKPAVSGSVRPATSSTVRRDARLPRGGRGQHGAQGPQRVDPRARDVGADGRLVAEGRVGDDVGQLPEAEQQPRAVHAPAVEAEGHDDERELQDVADRIGEVEGDVDRVALGDPGQRGEDERGDDRGGGQAAHRAVEPLRGADRAQARAQQQQQAGVDRDVAAEVQAVGDARVGRVLEVAEPQRPHEVAARPEEQAEADERPRAALAAPHGGGEQAHRAADPHHAGVDPAGDRVVDRAVARPDQGMHRVHGEAEGEHGEDGADDPRGHLATRFIGRWAAKLLPRVQAGWPGRCAIAAPWSAQCRADAPFCEDPIHPRRRAARARAARRRLRQQHQRERRRQVRRQGRVRGQEPEAGPRGPRRRRLRRSIRPRARPTSTRSPRCPRAPAPRRPR